MIKRLLLLFISVFFLMCPVRAQDSGNSTMANQVLLSLNTENGLAQGYINGIAQDSAGFIWMGTRDGLARYDGHEVKIFHYDPADTSGITSDVIQTIYADRHNQLWILYENQAIDIFNPLTEEVRHIRREGPFGWLLQERQVFPFAFLQDSHDRYWVVHHSLKQLRYFSMQNPRPVNVPLPEGERILAIAEGEDGTMYTCTNHAFYAIQNKRFRKIAELPYRPERYNGRISQMVQDKRGNWVIMNNGFLEVLRPDGSWSVIPEPPTTYSTPINFIRRSPEGGIYFNSANRIVRLNPDESLTVVWTSPHDPGDIPAMMIDRSNLLWVGTNTFGVKAIDLSPAGFRSYAYTHGFLMDVLERRFNLAYREKYQRYVDSYETRYAYDQEGRCWVFGIPPLSPESATREDRLRLLRTTDNKSILLDTLNPLRFPFTFDYRNRCWGILSAEDGSKGALLVQLNLNSGAVISRHALPHMVEETGYLTAFGKQLCVVYHNGIELYDPETGISRHYKNKEFLGNVKILMAVPDPNDPDVLWITSLGAGLIRLHTESGQMKTFTIKDGIPSNSVYAAVPDNNGFLWCSSNQGIFRFNPSNRQVLSFVKEDGLQGNEFNRYHFLKSPSGHIMFGGTRGWTVFHPDSVAIDLGEPEAMITAILVNNAPLSRIPAWKDRAVTALQTLSLNHEQNFITFHFAGLQFSNPGKLQYRYQLEGLDKDWIRVGSQHMANYTNLSPGRYTFKVNASNEAGIWSKQIKTLSLFIHPPWWKTGWAYGIYAFLVLGCGYAISRYRAGRLRIQRQMILQEKEARQLRRMDEIKTRFFSNITHEFRTPLSLIIAPLEQIARETGIPPAVKRKLAGIGRNARQLLQLINQLLDIAKIEAGNMPASLSSGDLNEFVAEQVSTFEEQAGIKQIRLSYECPLQGSYYFDTDKWQKILFNLLSNAIKFTPEGGRVQVGLTATATRDKAPLQTIILEVKDSGIGIPADKQAAIFKRFYQADDSQTRTYDGTGIGLALARELTELMKGSIEVESEPGSGALFRVTVPLEPAAKVEALATNIGAATGAKVEAGQVTPADSKAASILLVEDNRELNHFLAETLGKNFRVISAYNGKEAITAAEESLPDLIISDIMMPEMDGYALCSAIKQSAGTDHIAVILLSAKVSHNSVVKGLENQADDYISKPFHIDELLLRVHNLIARQRKLRDYYYGQFTSPEEQLETQSVTNRFLKKTYSIIEAHLDDAQFNVAGLADEMSISRRTLNRKLSALVNLSASEVIRQYRLKKAAMLLQSGLNVSETAYRVGFTSVSYFSNSFKLFYRATPSDYRNGQSNAASK